ncbi:MAG: HYR domain-containing protein [Saprospiraceae bacterium]|nr:HYR domain-containing protein [Candidatus Defluviibacterium haderslevense]
MKLRFTRFSIIIAAIFVLSNNIYSQVDLVASGGTTMMSYTTVKAAFDAINAGTHTGNITLNISGNTSEPVGGAILNASGSGSSSYTSILIKPTGGAARTITGAATAGLPLIELNGADNITVDGLNTGGNSLTIDNTTISSTSGTSTLRLQGDATNNLFTNVSINGASTMGSTTNGGNVWIGAGAITTGNDNNQFQSCKFGPSTAGLPTKTFYGNGSTTSTTTYNSNITINNCEFFDYFNATTQSNGIYVGGANADWIISNNKFYQTAARTQTTGTVHASIQLASTNINNCLISGNTIGYSANNATGTYTFNGLASTRFYGIYISNLGTTSTTTVQNNTITAISLSGAFSGTSTSGPFFGIYLVGLSDAKNNTIGSLDNSTNISISSTSTSTGEVYGIYNFSSSFTNISDNKIGSITVTNNTTGSSIFCGIRLNTASGQAATVSNNIIGGTTTNSINNTATATSSRIIGIQNDLPFATITGNTIRNFTMSAPNVGTGTSASVVGILQSATSTSGNHLISLNTIHTLKNTNASSAVWVTGINATGPTSTTTITYSNNLIHSLGFSSTTAQINGINITGGTALYANNMIRLGIDDSGSDINVGGIINGINETVGTNNFYFNSIYIGGSAVSNGSSNTFALNSSITVNARNYLNNIFYNARSNSGSTGKHYAIKVGGSGTNPTGLTINYNDYYVTGTGGFVGQYNAIDQTTLADWRTAIGQDCNSISGDPKYINQNGSASTVDLHISASLASVVEAGGTNISSITQDFDNQTRSSLTPTDIGADAGNFIANDISGPAIILTPLIAACGTGDIALNNVNIIDGSGVPTSGTLVPRIYFKKNAGAWFSRPGTLGSGTSTNGFWNFNIVVADLGGIILGDIISYYVIAQDIKSPTNISSNPSCVSAVDVNNVTIPPATPYTMNVLSALNGTYTVGIGGNYTTLTAAVNAYNTSCVTGSVIFSLIDATYPSETFPITINQISGQSSVNTLTIKPNTGVNATLSGSSSTGLLVLNGADYVTINGSNGNVINSVCPLVTASRNLTIMNTNASTTSAVIWLQTATGSNGATNNNILNCNIEGQSNTSTLFGIGSGSTSISTTSLGTGNSFNSFINNSIKKTQFGIYTQGASISNKNEGNTINLNLINSASPDNVAKGGIQLGFENNAMVLANNVSNISQTSSPDVFGIALGLTTISGTGFTGNEVTNTTVSKNMVGVISNTGTFSSCGITAASATSGTNIIDNNIVSGVFANGTSGDFAAGIFLGGGVGSTTKVYYNTVQLSGTGTGGSQNNVALAIGGVTPIVDIKNNILGSIGNNGTGNNYAIGLAYTSTVGNYANLTSDYNNFFFAPGGGSLSGIGVVGALATGGTQKLTLANWQAETGRDLNSINVTPLFVSSSNLHLVMDPANACLNQTATPIPGFTVDIDCATRSTTNPDIGADEFNGTDITIAITETSGTPNNKTICIGASATIATTGGISHKWSTGAVTTSINVSPSITTIYADTVTLAGGCKVVMVDTVNVVGLPTASISPSAPTICQGKSVGLTASGGVSYFWSTGESTSFITVSPSTSTTYVVTVTNANGCTATASVFVMVNPAPPGSISPLNPSICESQSITLTGNGGSSYFWSTGASTTSITVSPSITTTYTVTVTGSNGCTATASSTVNIKPSPIITETHIEPTTCTSLNGSIDLTVSGGVGPFTYNWFTSDGAGLVNGTQDQTNISVGTYVVTVTGNNSCSSTKSISLVGPGGCFICPTIGGLSKSTNVTCKTSPITLTATGLVNMGSTYGITFKYSLSALPDPYVGGTVLGTVPNGGLTGGGTTAVLNTTIPVAGNYFLYAILSPTPIATSCRPSANNTIIITLCEVTISDPCSCLNNATNTANGQFGEQVKVTAPSGQIWTLTANTGLFTTTSPAPPGTPVLIPLGTILTEMAVGDGTSMYVLNGRHIDAKGYSVTVSNGTFTSSIGETCYYPNPQIDNLNATYCITDPPFTLLGSARLGDNSGVATGVGTFMVNGTTTTTFNPATLGRGVHTVKFSFDAANGVPNGTHPGCIQDTTRTTVVDTTRPTNVCPVALNVGCATDVPAPNPALVIVTDNCPGPYSTVFLTDVITNQTCANRYTVTRTYRTTDAAGNSTTCSQTITVNDITHPSLICPAPATLMCASLVPAPDPNLVVAADLCGNIGITKAFVSDAITNQTCANRYTLTRIYSASDVCGNLGTCTQIITVNDQTVPVIVCKNITVSVPLSGSIVVLPSGMIVSATDNCGGAAGVTLTASQTTFTCADLGIKNITVRATDACGLFSTCIASVTVQDNILPVINCSKDYTVHLDPGECSRIINFALPDATDNCTPPPTVVQTGGLVSGSDFPRGVSCLTFKATDAGGNMATCTYCITVLEYANPIRELACNDEVQISLDQNCEATIGADMVLEGGPYGCYDDYIVQVRYWTTTGNGGLIDRNLTKPGIQINGNEIGRELKITIIDPETGNSCWGHATVEDKLAPLLTCPRDTCLPCSSPTTPAITGVPTVIENCGGASVSYRDNETQGGCAAGYELIIVRTWTAEDASGNKSTCVQKITVSLGTLATVSVPRNYDNIEEPALNCNEKIDPNKNVGPHMSDFPECVDGYLLDSAYWRANPNQPNIYPNRRIPRVLGWNCIDNPNSPNYGHPSPDVVYYPAHRQWSQTNPLCWGPDTRVMWHGTGRPSGSNCANLAITFQDIIFDLATPNCNAGPIGCYKVLRQWTVLDWCTSQVGGHNQIIKVIDQEGPQVLYPDSTRVNMETWTCTGRWEVPKPWLLDNCSEELHYSVEVENGTVLGDEIAGFVVIDLPEGIQYGYIIAVDCCGNITKKRVVLNVLDKTPPQAVCRTRTVVSLNGNQEPGTNYARLYAKDLNEGSFDNCQPHVWYKVIRMAELLGTNSGSNSNNVVACTGLNGDDNVVLAGNQVYFDDYTQFCCADVGQKIMVVLRVFDVDPGAGPLTPVSMTNPNSALFGRFSDCMVEVEVQDKSVPTVVAPPNMVVSCWYWFDINKATDPNDPTFGRVVTSLSNRAKVKTSDIVCHKFCERNQYTGYPGYVQTNQLPIPAPNLACNYYNQLFDTAHWDRKYELVWGFDGYAINACGTSATIVVNDLRECGQGQIQRIITATGPNNSRVNAIQTIWVVDCDPFFIDPLNCNDPRYSDIQWPNGVCNQNPIVIDGCGADISPENPQLGKPIVVNNADDNCSLISIEKFDEIFTIEPDACFKVLRKWVVIDWCQYDPFIDANFGRWEALQVIKVRDQDKPVVTCEVGPCEPAVIDPTLKVCVGHISLTATATDNCTPIDWLFWEYKIDAYNDGKGIHGGWDYRVGTLTQRQYNAGDTVEYSHNPFADDRHNPFNASGTYPIGIHKIRWNVEDGCGNTGVCETLFEIKDCKAPTPYCLTGIITVPMPSSGCVDIWAKDLDHGSYDNCTPKDKLKIYFDGDENKPSLTICCDDFVNAKVNDELIINVEMWVEDEEGNKDYCKTIIVVQDNDSICLNVGSFAKITGNIMTEGNEEARPVNVQLDRNARMMREMTGSPYSFGNLVVNDEYTIKPTRNDDHLNGVSTADIVKIQKHILGQTVITSPYKLIAADVNASGSITASDISEIRKLILGVSPSFTKVQSWTFVPSSYTFFDPTKPWTAPRSSIVIPTSPIEYKENFMAIKMGDVNGNAKAGLAGTAIRTTGTLNFVIEEGSVVEGQTYRMNVKSSDFANIAGYQFTMKYDNESLVYEGVERGSLNINESNIGTIRSGVITTSWNSNVGESYKSNEVLYSIVFKATRSGNISKMISITSDVTRAEAYDNLDQVKEVKLGVRTDKGIVETGVFELYQNEPNPFSKESVISYRLPEASAVKLTVYDVTGKVVRVYELAGQKGLNTYKITKSELNTSGVLYYQLDAADHTSTKRMIVVE